MAKNTRKTRYSLCLIIFHLYLNLVSSPFEIFAESEILLTILLLKLLLHLLFIPRLTSATPSFLTFLALNLIIFNSFLTLLLALFLKLLNSPIFHPFSNNYIGLNSINAFTTKLVHYILHNLLYVQSNTFTRSSATLTFKRSTIYSRRKITDSSFTHHTPVLWNRLPKELRQLAVIHFSHAYQSDSTTSLVALSPSLFHSKLETHLFRQSFSL